MAIWSKGGDDTEAIVHAFTVGDDWQYDRVLAPYDILGSIAHVRMLARIGILNAAEMAALVEGLRQLHREYSAGGWTVESSDEDVHSKIELLLTQRLGEPAKKLHTGRSRNDQVLTALRLWEKDALVGCAEEVLACIAALLAQARAHEFHPLPGYTHLQRAMPSSVGMFFAAHAQGLLDDLLLLEAAYRFIDACPLGSGASYGVGLPLDREYAARLLGFARWGGVALADANSRGKGEAAVLDAIASIVTDLNRYASDLVFFTSQEAGFFTIGKGFTTGSSIMPQKRNPDLFELIRARCARFHALRAGLAGIVHGLPSGYARDLQDTKALVIDGVEIARGIVTVATAATPTLVPVRERILAALSPDIYATDEAYRLVREQGLPFRDAYRIVGCSLDRLQDPDHDAVVRSRTHAGSTGNLGLPHLQARLAEEQAAWHGRRARYEGLWHSLLDGPLR
ncbi:MAG: argininosuccinate lyase [Planctomycetota bacterium]|nr:argininosuccinate lyase [Planctomycetota bacterium]MDW8373349.1 argininosuccinate lyase [Planctomycetota bacterium]